MTKNMLIGICGAIGSGKSTVSDYLVEQHGFKVVGFALPLKDLVQKTLGIEHHHLHGCSPETQVEDKLAPIPHLRNVGAQFAVFGGPWPDRVGKPWCGRWVLEFVGTECFRAVYGLVWVDLALSQIMEERAAFADNDPEPGFERHSVSRHNRHVFGDVRFMNEANAIQAAGGSIWRTEKVVSSGNLQSTGHDSDEEWKLIQPDFKLSADPGDLGALRRYADTLVSHA